MAPSGFEFFMFFTLVPPSTVFQVRDEGISVSVSAVIRWNLLIHIKHEEAAVWQAYALVATPEERRKQ